MSYSKIIQERDKIMSLVNTNYINELMPCLCNFLPDERLVIQGNAYFNDTHGQGWLTICLLIHLGIMEVREHLLP